MCSVRPSAADLSPPASVSCLPVCVFGLLVHDTRCVLEIQQRQQMLEAVDPLRSVGEIPRSEEAAFMQIGNLEYLSKRTDIPLILLLGGWTGYVTPDTGESHAEITTAERLDEIAKIVSGAGPPAVLPPPLIMKHSDCGLLQV
jgi:hypothetical protein